MANEHTALEIQAGHNNNQVSCSVPIHIIIFALGITHHWYFHNILHNASRISFQVATAHCAQELFMHYVKADLLPSPLSSTTHYWAHNITEFHLPLCCPVVKSCGTLLQLFLESNLDLSTLKNCVQIITSSYSLVHHECTKQSRSQQRSY